MSFCRLLLIASVFLGGGKLHSQYSPFAEEDSSKIYRYKALQPNFTEDFEKAKSTNKLADFFRQQLQKINEQKDLLAAESKLHSLQILIAMDKPLTAIAGLLQLAEENLGNRLAEYALYLLSDLLLHRYAFPEPLLVSYFGRNTFQTMHPQIASMPAFYRALFFQQKSFADWSFREIQKLEASSPWSKRLQYRALVHDILREGRDNIFQDLQAFYQLNRKELGLLDGRDLNLLAARILYEDVEFAKSYRVYEASEPFAERLQGRILLEMAWSKWNAQDYAHSLGLLQLLKAPLYRLSRSPQNYILEALIYRDLCHYERIAMVEKAFLEDFATSLKTLERRFGHDKDVDLVNQVLLDEDLASLSQNLYDAQKELEHWYKHQPKAWFLKALEKTQKQIKARLQIEVEKRLPAAMDEFLRVKQELSYLTYLAKLETMRQSENPKLYRSEQAKDANYEKLFWRTAGEYWRDELKDLRVLIDSRCGGRP